MEAGTLNVLSGNNPLNQNMVAAARNLPILIERRRQPLTNETSIHTRKIVEERNCMFSFSDIFGFIFCSFGRLPDKYAPSASLISSPSTNKPASVAKEKKKKNTAGKFACKAIDVSHEDYGMLLKEEMIRIFHLYAGYSDDPDLMINYELKSEKNGIKVFLGNLPGSSWPVIKSISKIKTDKQSILDLLTTDSRTGEYDDTFQSAKV